MSSLNSQDQNNTVRQRMVQVLKEAEYPLSAKDLSARLQITTKEILEHMGHIQKSQKKFSGRIDISPAQCRKCGFGFSKRKKFSKPGKCPLCKSQYIEPPAFFWQESP